MSAESFGRRIHLAKFPNGSVAISVDTDYGRMPVLAFPSWEGFEEFVSAIQEFQRKMKPDVPAFYMQVANENRNP